MRPQPKWLREGLIFVGNWETLVARTRHGGLAENMRELYKAEHSEEVVRRLKDVGVNMILMHYFKTGLRVEEEERAYAEQLAGFCRKYGMRVGAYIGGTIYYETLAQDDEDCVNWAARDEDGRPIRRSLSSGLCRYKPCYNQPGYRAFIRRVVEMAVKELGTDLVHFDNFGDSAEPACHCGECVRKFSKFLETKYRDASIRLERYGFTDFSRIRPPIFPKTVPPEKYPLVRDPSVQDWMEFGSECLTDFYREMSDLILELNPEVAVECNPGGIRPGNWRYYCGVDLPRLVVHGDVFWTEENAEPRLEDGRLISRIRTFKAAQSLGNVLFSYALGPHTTRFRRFSKDARLPVLEPMVLGGPTIGCVGMMWEGGEVEEIEKNLRSPDFAFFLKHRSRFVDTEPVTDVAVVRSFSSMAFNAVDPHRDVWFFEQALIQSAVTFTLAFDRDLNEGCPYRVLVLAGQECISEEQVRFLEAFLQAGGGVVLVENSGTHDAWHRVRTETLTNVLRALADEVETLENGVTQARIGRGRAAIAPSIVATADDPLGPFDWRRPENWKDLLEAVRWAAGGRLSVEVEAPPSFIVEVRRQTEPDRLLIHLLNFESVSPGPDLRVSVAIPEFARPARCIELSPEEPEGREVHFESDDDGIAFEVSGVEKYRLVVIDG